MFDLGGNDGGWETDNSRSPTSGSAGRGLPPLALLRLSPGSLLLAPLRCAPVSLGERHLSASPPRFLWLHFAGVWGPRGEAGPPGGASPRLFAVIAQPVRPMGGSRNEKRGGENLRNTLVGAPSRFQVVFLPACPGLSLVVWGPRAGVRFVSFLAWKVHKSLTTIYKIGYGRNR